MTIHPQHTPTLVVSENIPKDIINDKGDLIARCCDMLSAAYIVRAVNAHEELISLLKDVLESEYIDHTGTLTPVLHAGDLRGMIVKAVAKAEGK